MGHSCEFSYTETQSSWTGDCIFLFSCRFHLDPSGTYTRYDAKAIGAGSEGAQSSLQEVFHKVWTNVHGTYVHQYMVRVSFA